MGYALGVLLKLIKSKRKMAKIISQIHRLNRIFFVGFMVSSLVTLCVAQQDPDLELKAESRARKVHGGEKFSYSFTVTNRKDTVVKTVMLAHDIPEELTFISASVSRGTFKVNKSGISTKGKQVQAEFGDIEGLATVILTVEAKVKDWGDISLPMDVSGDPAVPSPNFSRVPLSWPGSQLKPATAPDTTEWAVPLYIRVDAVSHGEGYYLDFNEMPAYSVELLPSKNIPPRIEILSPGSEKIFVKPATKEIEVPIRIKAFDPDGTIKKLVIHDNFNPQFHMKLEDGVYKYVIGGKTFTQSEVEERSEDEEFRRLLEVRLTPTSGDTYVYNAKRFHYGENTILIAATDDGGRVTNWEAKFKVKSDSTVELIKPLADVFLPGAAVIVETISKVGEGVTPKVTLGGTKGYYESQDPEMQLVSHIGNTYIHRFTWKVGKDGLYDLTPKLFENGQDTGVSDWMRTVAATPRTIKITSLRNGQIFTRGERITVSTRGTDIGGKVIFDKLELIVDGKLNGEIPISQQHGPPPTYTVISTGYADRYILDLQPGPHTVQVISRHEFGTKLGASDLVKIIVK